MKLAERLGLVVAVASAAALILSRAAHAYPFFDILWWIRR
jgi:hypothetical protein